LLVEDAVFRAAIVVAVASTAFTIFVVPNSVAASPRRVIGGHVVAVIVGTTLAFVLQIPALESASEEFRYIRDIAAALSVGMSIFVMVVTNTEHPPAAGTALGLLIPGWTLSAVTFILLSALILSIIRLVLRPKLINLL
ncbi:MAG: HPP family protein, partial [Chloroflexi bacterium]|nr:HPP family protein [Chloroflexota bacterium]